ncbi:MAG TPA: hypothetical protein VFJ29_06125 [Candidatus Kapabacteria bacterium]|nr:hypothetical protein [Candidatus Kapabacteria bacterium]
MPSLSFFQSLSIFIHVIGFGIVFGMMLVGPIIEKQFQTATDWSARAKLGMVSKRLAMFSPVAIIILLLSGIGNMMTFGFTMSDAFSGAAWWLGVKIVLFVCLALNGIFNARKLGEARGVIIMGAMQGKGGAEAEAALQATYKRMNMFFRIQGFMLTVVVIMAIFRP